MMRKMVVVGDRPAPGGAVLPYSSREYSLHGHQVALIGGRAYCEGCNSVGIIAKAGGRGRMGFISEVALEGDVVICHCPVPPPIIATLVHTSWFEDMGGGIGNMEPHMLVPGWLKADSSSMAASKKLVDSEVTHPPEAEQTENICPNMTNREFVTLALRLRDKAINLTERRLNDLETWGEPERQRVATWFGSNDEAVRQHLRVGLKRCIPVLKNLTGDNFVRYSASAMRNVGCTPSGNKRIAAEVCKPDVATHTIGIGIEFCGLREISPEKDSQLATLIHEVTHFNDTFASNDTEYTFPKSLDLAKTDRSAARINADSIAGYVVWGTIYEG